MDHFKKELFGIHTLELSIRCYFCGDQLLVNCFDITNIYINVHDKDVIYGSAHVKKYHKLVQAGRCRIA